MNRASVRTLLKPCIVFAVVVLSSFTLRAEDVPQPIDLGTKDVSVYVAVPNLNSLLDNAEAVAKQFNPQQPPGQLKMTLGFMLGDPALANLDASKPIVAMLFKTPPTDTPAGPPPFALFIPAKAAAPFDGAFTRMKMVTSFSGGVLVVAQTADALTLGQTQLAAYQKIADAKIKGDVRVYLGAANLMESFGPLVQKGMDLVKQQLAVATAANPAAAGMDPQALGKILGIEMKVLAEMLNELDSVQYDISIKADQINVEHLVCAKKESPLAALFGTPPPGINKTLMLLSKSGSMTGAFRISPAGYKVFINKMISLVTKDPEFADVGGKDVQEMFSGMADYMGGDMAMSMDLLPTGGMAMEMAVTITDDKKYLTFVENMVKLMGPDGSLGKMYADMGMKMTAELQKAVRQHGGVDVHRMKIDFDTTKMAPAQAAQIKNMPKETDVAIVKGLYLGSYDPAELDKLIDKALAGNVKPDVSLESISAFGDGKQVYMDLDAIGFMQNAMAAMPGNPASAMFSQLKSKAPMLMAGSYNGGRFFGQIRVPLAPFIEMSTIARKGAGKAPAPAPGPGDGDEKKDEKF